MTRSGPQPPAVWFPTIEAGSGADVYTRRLRDGLVARGIRAEITWLPLRSEYAPWTVAIPQPPGWATVAHVNTWMHRRFLPRDLPVVATLHHAVHHPDARASKGALRSAYHRCWIAPNERRVLRRADRVVAVSNFVAEMARQTLCDVPMQVIHNGVDTELFRPGNRMRQPGAPFRLLYVGAWRKLKGVDLLAPIMRELGDGFELHYTGGPAAEQDKAGMPGNMIDLGRLHGDAAVVAAMQDADALLFPSRSEGFGLVAAEAMACGLPVLTTRSASLVEVVAHERTGLLCPPGDVAAFVKAIRSLANDARALEAMGVAARREACERFSVQSMLDAHIRLYTAANAAARSGISAANPAGVR